MEVHNASINRRYFAPSEILLSNARQLMMGLKQPHTRDKEPTANKARYNYPVDNTQEDAAEFLSVLLNEMLLDDTNSHQPMSNAEPNIQSIAQAMSLELFDQVRCPHKTHDQQCLSSHDSTSKQELILALQITYLDKINQIDIMNYHHSLHECLIDYFKDEFINSFKCDDCQKMGKMKRICISRTPPALVLQLKRFNNRGVKLVAPITFEQTLNLEGYSNCNQQPSSYDYALYAVLCHYGSTVEFGHYIIYVKKNENSWIKIDDHQITEVDVKDVLNEKQNAYVIAYVQKTFTVSEGELPEQQSMKIERKQTTSSMSNKRHDQQKQKSSQPYRCQSTITIGNANDTDAISSLISKDRIIDDLDYDEIYHNSILHDHGFNDTPLLVQHSQNTIRRNIPRLRQDEQSVLHVSQPNKNEKHNKFSLITTNDHKHINNDDTRFKTRHNNKNIDSEDLELINVATSAPINETFKKSLPTTFNTRLAHKDFESLKQLQNEHCKQEVNKLLGNTKNQRRNSDYRWLHILLPYFKQYNPYCSGNFKHKNYGRLSNTNSTTNYVLSCNIYCKRKECAFFCRALVKTNGFIYIFTRPSARTTKNNINHAYEPTNVVNHDCYLAARCLRNPDRSSLQLLMAKGVTQRQLYYEMKEERTKEEKCAFNCDRFGTSLRTIKKIKAEFKASLYNAQDEDVSIKRIHEKWLQKLSEAKCVPGAVQFMSTTPSLIVIVYTEATI
ncbi:unnamed protein product, partial [Didymodactylos carnosus]